MKSRLLTFSVLLMLVVVLLASCAQPPAATAPPQATEAPVAEATEAPAAEATEPPAAQEKTACTLWMGGDDARFMMDSPIPARFEAQYPQYDLEVVQLPWDGMHDKLVAGFSGGDLPDVAGGADQWIGEFADLGGLLPLDDWKAEKGYKDEDFLPGSWEHFRYVDGVLYAAPFQAESRLLFYREDLLKEAGFDGPPKTTEEMMEMAKALSNGDDQFGMADQTQWLDFHFFSYLLYAAGGDFYNKERTACTLTDPAGIEALTYYQNLYKDNAAPSDPAKRVEGFTGFKEGYYAMAESGAWWFGLIKAQAPELGAAGEGKWNVTVLPENKTTVAYGHPNPWLIPAGAKNPQCGKDWISFMYQPENGVEWAMTYGQPPTVLAAYEDPQMQNDMTQQALLASSQRGTNSIHNVRGAEAITQIVWNALSDLKDDKATPEQAAQSVCDQMQQYLFEP